VFENECLRKICGPKRKEVKGDWERLYKKELHDFKVFFSPNNFRVIKSTSLLVGVCRNA
jgi:hypothetical protein